MNFNVRVYSVNSYWHFALCQVVIFTPGTRLLVTESRVQNTIVIISNLVAWKCKTSYQAWSLSVLIFFFLEHYTHIFLVVRFY